MVMVYITVDFNVLWVGKMGVKQKKSTAVVLQHKSSAAMNLQVISAQFSKLYFVFEVNLQWDVHPSKIILSKVVLFP